jgi:hypothetical protein
VGLEWGGWDIKKIYFVILKIYEFNEGANAQR